MNGFLSGGVGDEFPHIKSKFLFDAPPCRRGASLKKGVIYMVLSAFTTTLMMVGIITYPIEKAYFGTKVTIIRNIISLFIALIVAVMTGIFFGEIF